MGTTVDWEAFTDEVRRRHGAHTVLLYGSRARGDATEHSDVDAIAIRASGGKARDLGAWRGLSLDLHLFDDGDVAALIESRASALADARVLCQQDGLGDRILEGVRARLSNPCPVPAGSLAALWAWGDKTRRRIEHPNPLLAAYYRVNLLVEALPAWAEARGRWFFGGKAAIGSLGRGDPAMHAAYLAAAQPHADVTAFHRLLDVVFDERLRPAATTGPVEVPSPQPDAPQ